MSRPLWPSWRARIFSPPIFQTIIIFVVKSPSYEVINSHLPRFRRIFASTRQPPPIGWLLGKRQRSTSAASGQTDRAGIASRNPYTYRRYWWRSRTSSDFIASVWVIDKGEQGKTKKPSDTLRQLCNLTVYYFTTVSREELHITGPNEWVPYPSIFPYFSGLALLRTT